MRLSIICFTKNGYELMQRIARAEDCFQWDLYCKCKELKECNVSESIYDWTSRQWKEADGLIFIGAIGIAVRAIAPLLEDKLKDIPVICMDDAGRHVIPVLSGHFGGANALAIKLSAIIGAEPVITTATDVHGCFAVDVWAKENDLIIYNKDGIAKVSAKVLDGKDISILSTDGQLGLNIVSGTNEFADVLVSSNISETEKFQADLYLLKRGYVVGIGCKRGKSADEIETAVKSALEQASQLIDLRQISKVASIDVKADEAGLIEFAKRYSAEFVCYSSEELLNAPGEFKDSDFVRSQVGVGNVCERAASLAAGPTSHLILHKTALSGVTVALLGTDVFTEMTCPQIKWYN